MGERSERQGQGDVLGRAALVAYAVERLAAGQSVLITSPAGSRPAQVALDARSVAAARGASPVRVVIQRDASVDDAQRFASAVRSGALGIWVAEGDPADPQIRGLVGRGSLVEIELPPVAPADLLRFVEHQLGGRLEPRTVPLLVPSQAGWDLDLLREVTAAHRRDGRLSPEGGRFVARDELALDRSLQAGVLARVTPAIDEIDENVVRAYCAIVALLPGLTVDSTVRVAGTVLIQPVPDALELLEEHGVVQVDRVTGGVEVRLRDGIHAHLLPAALGTLRRQRYEVAILDALLPHGGVTLTEKELVGVAQLALAHDRDVPADMLSNAARASLRGSSPESALRLATAANDGAPGFDSQMVLASAELLVGATETAMERLQRLVTEARDDVERSTAIAALIQQAVELPSSGEIAVGWVDGSDERMIGARKGFTLYALGDLAAAAEHIEPALPLLRGEALAHAYTIVATTAMVQGRLSRSRGFFERAQQVTEELGGDISRILVARANLEAFDGQVLSSIRVVSDVRSKAGLYGQRAAEAMLGWADATLLLTMGAVPRATVALSHALETLEDLSIARTALLVRVDLAIALAMSGRTAESRSILDVALEALRGGTGSAPNAEKKVLEAEGWLAASEGRVDLAADRFLDAAEVFRADGLVIGELSTVLNAVRAGASGPVVDRLRDLGRRVDGALASVAVGLADAGGRIVGATGDPAALSQVALSFEALGEQAVRAELLIIAAESFAHAARLHEEAGEPRDAAAAARRRDEQMRICGLDRLVLVPERRVRALSVREGEIADLAAAGMSNREISEKLVLSIRTVETHLLRVYQKLGIRRRGELAEALVGVPRASVEDA